MTDQPPNRDFLGKLDVIGKLLSTVVLAAIALFLKDGAAEVQKASEDVASALRKGQLVQSLVSDLATKQDTVRQDLALIALDRSTTKDDNDLVDEIAEEILVNQPTSGTYFGRTPFRIIERRDPQRAKTLKSETLACLIHQRCERGDQGVADSGVERRKRLIGNETGS